MMNNDESEAERMLERRRAKQLKAKLERLSLKKITHCNCCGAEKIDGVGECYTDCMWYDGPLPRDANPH